MFKGLKDKVGKSITQANNRLRVNKNETSQDPNNSQKRASFQSSTMSASPSNSLIDLNCDNASTSHTPNQSALSQSTNQPCVVIQTTDQSPAILALSNYESSEDIPVDNHLKGENKEIPESGVKQEYDARTPLSKTPSTPTHNNTHPVIRHRNDSLSSQVSDTFFFSPNSAFMPSPQFLTSDVESIASEVEDHNLIDSLGVGPSGHDRIGRRESIGGGRNVESVSKDDLLKVFKKIHAKNQKYSGKYTQLVSAYRELDKERLKLKEVLTKCQDKAIQRISELKEQLSLKQMAMNDVEVNYTMMLQEKQELIKVLQMQVAVLKEGLKVNKDGEIVEVGSSREVKEGKQDDVMAELNMLKEKNAKLTKLLGNCKTTILDHREEIKRVVQERDQLKNESCEKEGFEKLKEELKEKVEDLQEELDNYKEEKRRWVEGEGGKGGLLEEDLRRLIEEKMDLEEKLSTLADENKKLKIKLKDFEARLQQPQSLIDVAGDKAVVSEAVARSAAVATVESLIDMQTTSSSSSSLPSSSMFGEHRTIVANLNQQVDVGGEERLALDRLICENNEIKKNLTKFKNQAKIFKNICQCVFKAVVIDLNNVDNVPKNSDRHDIFNTSSHSSSEQPCANTSTTLNHQNRSDEAAKGTEVTDFDPQVQALYTRLYDDSKSFMGGKSDFLYINNIELRKSIVSVLKSGLDKSMSKLKGRVDIKNNEERSVTIITGDNDDAHDVEAVNNTTTASNESNKLESSYRSDGDHDDDWVTDDEEEEDDESKANTSGAYIDDYESLALHNGDDDYLQRLLLKWKESCDKYEVHQSRRQASLPLQQPRSVELVQVEQCTPITTKTSPSKLVVVSDEQAGSDRVDANSYCDTDDDKLIKSSLLDKYECLRCEHEQLLESYDALRVELEGVAAVRGEAAVESDEVKAQQQQVLSSEAGSEERLMRMSEVNRDISTKYSSLCEEMAVLQEGFNDALKEKMEVEKDLMLRIDEMNLMQDQNHALSFETESLKNELSKVNMELKVKFEDYEHLATEYKQVCEEVSNEKSVMGKLKATLVGMERSSEGLGRELEGLRHENSSLKEGNEELKKGLSREEKKVGELRDFVVTLETDIVRMNDEYKGLLNDKCELEQILAIKESRLSEVEESHQGLVKKEEALQKENMDYISKSEELRAKLEESLNLNETLSVEISELKKNDEIISKMEEVSRERDGLKEEVVVLKEQIDQLQIRVEVVQDDLQKCIEGREAEDEEMSQLQGNYDTLVEKLREAEEGLKDKVSVEQGMESVKIELDMFKKEVEILKGERDVCNEEAKVRQELNDALKNKLSESGVKSEEMAKEMACLKEQLEAKRAECLQEVETLKSSHKEKLEFLKKKFEDIKNDGKTKLAEKDEKIASLIVELEQVRRETSDFSKLNEEKVSLFAEKESKLEERYQALKHEYEDSLEKKSQNDLENKKLVDDLNDLIGTLLHTKEDYEKRHEENNKELKELKESENKLKDEIDGLKNEMAKKEEEVLRIQGRLEEVEAREGGVQGRAEELQLQSHQQLQELSRLNERLLEMEAVRVQASEKTKVMEEEITMKSERALQSVNESCREYENKMAALKDDFEGKLSKKDDEIVLKAKEKEDLERTMNEMLKEKDKEIYEFQQKLEDKLSEVEKVKITLDEYKHNLEILNVKASDVISERDGLKNENTKIRIELEESHSNSSKTAQEINAKMASLQSENEAFKQEIEALKVSKEGLAEEHQRKVEEDSKMLLNLEAAMKEKDDGWVEKMNEFKKRAETKIKQIKKQKDDYADEVSVREEAMKREVQKLKEDLNSKDNQIAEITSKYELLKKSLENEGDASVEKDKDLDELKERLQELQRTLSEKESQLEEESASRKELVEKLEGSNRGEVELVESECKLLRQESTSLHENIIVLKKELEDLAAENVELKGKCEGLSSSSEASAKELKKELKSLSKDYNKLKEEYAHLEEERKRLTEDAEKEKNTEIERLKQEYSEEMAEREGENKDKIKKLMREFQTTLSNKQKQYQSNFTKTLESAEQESEERLKELEGELEEVRQEVRDRDDQLDHLSQQMSEMHSRGEWEEVVERCDEMERRLEEMAAERSKLLQEEEERRKKSEENERENNHAVNLSDLKRLSQTDSQMSLDSSCSIIPVEFEYLKAVLYKYMTETPEKETLAKVLCRIMRYNDREENLVLSFHRR